MPFTFTPLLLPGVMLVEPRVFADERGFFLEIFKLSEAAEGGIADCLAQVNHSHSIHSVLRGLHYQKPPMAQAKLVTVVCGEIFDVAVDIRHGSPTYGHWLGERLSAQNHRALYIPPGFAHGFCVLSASADVVYFASAEYAPACDRGIRWDDPEIGIDWPIADPLLSSKDRQQPLLCEADADFIYGEC